MSRRRRFAPALLLLTSLAGCHLTGALPVDLDAGHGRADRTYTINLGTAVRATLDALDDLEVAPQALVVRANDRQSDLGKPKWAGQSNGEYFPNDASFRDLFEFQRLNVEGAGPTPFAPLLVSYRGELRDGRDVVVVIRSLPPEARETRILTRVGRNGDEILSRKLLDNVAERLNRLPRSPDAPAPAPASPTAGSTPPADLPVLPPG